MNADNIRALRQKYRDLQVDIFCAEFDSPAFHQQAHAYFQVLSLVVVTVGIKFEINTIR